MLATKYGATYNGFKLLSDCRNWFSADKNDQLGYFPEFANAFYFARGAGPLPLNSASDYGIFSIIMFGDPYILLKQPEYAEDPRMITCIAMWSYMSYGRNGSSAPSIHDIFTGHWTPNSFERAAGYSENEPINAALGVVASQAQSYKTLFENQLTCKEYYIKEAKEKVPSGQQLG